MKKVARLRTSPTMTEDQQQLPPHHNLSNEPAVRTTGRIKKPKAVFDPSDNYLPRAQRLSAALIGSGSAAILPLDRRSSLSRLSTASTDSSSMAKEVCVVCGKRESKRTSFATKNPLIACLECECRIHRQCLKVDFDDFEQMRPKYKCERCKPCAICSKAGQDGMGEDKKILVCSKCTKAYHGQCLQPNTFKTEAEDVRNWKCPKCTLHAEITNGDSMPVKKIREIIGDQSPPDTSPNNATPITLAATLSSSPTSFSNSRSSDERSLKRSLDENGAGDDKDQKDDGPKIVKFAKAEDYEKSDNIETPVNKPVTPTTVASDRCSLNGQELDGIPDVKNWSVEQVFQYFQQQFPKEAHVFKEHEIDGGSLLLLKRSDVVKKLPLKLGPSLRIFSTILQIQTQHVDPTLGWNCSQ